MRERASVAMKCRPTANTTTKAAPKPRAAPTTRFLRASTKVSRATVRTPGRSAGSARDIGLSDDLEEELLQRRTPRGQAVEADALGGQPARQLRQALLRVHAEQESAPLRALHPAEAGEGRQ